jgi:hypothetical protein
MSHEKTMPDRAVACLARQLLHRFAKVTLERRFPSHLSHTKHWSNRALISRHMPFTKPTPEMTLIAHDHKMGCVKQRALQRL